MKAAVAASWGAHQWDAVLEQAAAFRQLFPPDAIVEQAMIEALRGTAKHAAAEAAIAQAEQRFHGEAWLAGERLKLALDQGNVTVAVELAEALRHRFPEFMDGYVLGAAALRQLRRDDEAVPLLEAAASLEPDNFWVLLERASLAERRADWDQVIALAEAMRRHSPNYDPGYRMALKALRHLGRTREAELLLKQAIGALSLQPWLCIEGMEIAQQEERFEQADCWLLRGIRRFSMDPDLALFHASRPARDPAERSRANGTERAITRLENLIEEMPELPDAVAVLAETLTAANRLDEAEALLTAHPSAVRKSSRTATTWGHSAEARGDFAEAARRYRQVAEWFPENYYAYEGLMIALATCGDRDGAERVCATAIARFPVALEVLMAQVKIAEIAEEFERAVALMAKLADAYPAVPYLKHRLYALRLKLGDSGQRAAALPRGPDLDSAGDDPKSIMMRCQSIGGTGLGCEFGLVQRRFGAEPLSLLRWGGVPHADLIRAIRDGFDGIDDESDMKIVLEPNRSDAEYELISKNYNIRFHSFMYQNEISAEKFKQQMRRRMSFLRQIFIDDLRAARHLFVRKQQAPIPSPSEIDDLHAAFARHGDNTLLYVFQADAAHPSGTVHLHKRGVIFGYVDRFIETAVGDLSATSWLEVCTRAHEIWRSSRVTASVREGVNPPLSTA
jgi:tetratricopeptide (TPR) repeat protein